ncbi:MAG TPA: CYCXC family (seleno)protein, partial [Pyrinomonadaceae bacterium]
GGASSEQAASPSPQPAATAAAEQPAPQTARLAPQAAHGAGETNAPAAHDSHEGHSHGAPGRVPRFAATAADLKNLPPVLPASKFTGMTRMAYAAVKEIPQTIAQLPCYCHCDEGFGHKSLQTCFVDEHASHCAVCVEEALLAYKLQKEERLTPAQIRERIIAQYGGEN